MNDSSEIPWVSDKNVGNSAQSMAKLESEILQIKLIRVKLSQINS